MVDNEQNDAIKEETQAVAPQPILVMTQKNAGMAAVLSFFFPGLGQIYNGQLLKGFLLSVAGVISGLLVWVFIGIILLPIVWIYGIVDAYVQATRINQKMLAENLIGKIVARMPAAAESKKTSD